MLQKGTTLFIPYAKGQKNPNQKATTATTAAASQKTTAPAAAKPAATVSNAVKIGVMLPLHDVDGDGKRMVEYYRGILMACDYLKKHGVSTDVHAWNVPIDADIRTTLLQPEENGGSFASATANAQEVSLLSQTGRGYFITGVIGVGQEPTNHALKDIAKVAQVFEKWNRPIVLLFEDETSAQKFRISEFPGLPKNIIFGFDKDGAIRKQIVTNMKLQNANLLPMFILSDTFNRVVYISQGYTIGLGEQLETVIKKL